MRKIVPLTFALLLTVTTVGHAQALSILGVHIGANNDSSVNVDHTASFTTQADVSSDVRVQTRTAEHNDENISDDNEASHSTSSHSHADISVHGNNDAHGQIGNFVKLSDSVALKLKHSSASLFDIFSTFFVHMKTSVQGMFVTDAGSNINN